MSKSIKYVILFLVGFLTISCKKDKLTGDMEILIGTWNWHSTTKINSLCDPPSYNTELTPTSENKTYSIKFFKNGKVSFFENEIEIQAYRIVFTSFDKPNICNSSGFKYFNIILDNNENQTCQGCVSSDSMTIVRNFPFPDPEDACENYTSYFVKE